MAKFNILGVYVGNRVKSSQMLQKALTDCGCSIKLRIGLHEVDEKTCAVNGLIILQIFGGAKEMQKVKNKLRKVEGVKIKEMLF